MSNFLGAVQIVNAPYNETCNAANLNANILAEADNPVDNMRSLLSESEVTTYTYKPNIGKLTEKNPREVTTYYDYNGLGQLKEIYTIENGKKIVLNAHLHNYQNK